MRSETLIGEFRGSTIVKYPVRRGTIEPKYVSVLEWNKFDEKSLSGYSKLPFPRNLIFSFSKQDSRVFVKTNQQVRVSLKLKLVLFWPFFV